MKISENREILDKSEIKILYLKILKSKDLKNGWYLKRTA